MRMGFPGSSAGKESACKAGDSTSIPGSGSSPGEGIGYPFQYSCLENSMDYTVHGVTKSQTRLSNFHFTFIPNYRFPSRFSGKELACEFNPWVRKIPWRMKWQPTSVFLLGKFHGQGHLVGYSPWGLKTIRHDLATNQQQHPKLYTTTCSKVQFSQKKSFVQNLINFML